MKQTRLMMGIPIIVEVVDASVTTDAFDQVFAYLDYVDRKFSTYKPESEISRINRGELSVAQASEDMRLIFALAEETRQDTAGYFDIRHNGHIDPSGIVKGWAIREAADLLEENGFKNYYVDAGGDVQVMGKNASGETWRLGIRNPFNVQQIVKTLALTDCGIATSGSYLRGNHIYDPFNAGETLAEVLSLTVIGPDVYEADRFATAAFAMGREGINFIEQIAGLEGYMIDKNGQATYTSGFPHYVATPTSTM